MNESTCWTLIKGAAAGSNVDRADFVRRYSPMLHSYFEARWRGIPAGDEVEDAVQEVFLECLSEGGVLERVENRRAGGFRAYLQGVARNVALRIETRRRHRREEQERWSGGLAEVQADEASASRAFDHAWARTLIQEAAEVHAAGARKAGKAALARVDLLKLRFGEGLPIREIARRRNADPARVHHDYARARREFQAALRMVVSFHHPGPREEVEQHCLDLLALLRQSR